MTASIPIELRREHIRLGISPAHLERDARAGTMVRVTRGAYAAREEWTELTPEAQHLERVRILDGTSPGSYVFSHHSAAAIWGLPVVCGWPPEPHVVVSSQHGTSRRATFTAHTGHLDATEISAADGFTLTSKVRTALDIAAHASIEAGVVILDAVAADPAIGTSGLADSIAARRPFRGVRRIDAAMRHVTGSGESPLESLSVLRFAELGFARPEQQREFRISGGVYRVDFFWPEAEIIGEADGWSKYRDFDAITREKRREDDLRSRVRGFARWDWQDAWLRTGLHERLQRAGVPRNRANASRTR